MTHQVFAGLDPQGDTVQVNPDSRVVCKLQYSTLFQSLEPMPAGLEAEYQQQKLQSVHDSSPE